MEKIYPEWPIVNGNQAEIVELAFAKEIKYQLVDTTLRRGIGCSASRSALQELASKHHLALIGNS